MGEHAVYYYFANTIYEFGNRISLIPYPNKENWDSS